jgi:hypothetical protein
VNCSQNCLMRISVGVLVGIVLLVRRDRPGLSRLSLAPAGGHARCRHQLLGLGLARDVLLGIAFALWTAWWIWLLVAFLRAPHPRHSRSQP